MTKLTKPTTGENNKISNDIQQLVRAIGDRNNAIEESEDEYFHSRHYRTKLPSFELVRHANECHLRVVEDENDLSMSSSASSSEQIEFPKLRWHVAVALRSTAEADDVQRSTPSGPSTVNFEVQYRPAKKRRKISACLRTV